MRLTLIRNATVLVEIGGTRILVDPMLDDAGARPPIENTANPVPNPTVPLPLEFPDENAPFIVTFYFNETPPGGGSQ